MSFKFSIITPSLNCGKCLEDNLYSVQEQGLSTDDVQHIVIDGGSSDNSIAILKRHRHITWISEPDEGLSDAVNKGIALAKGEWIIWLNADDRLAPGALSTFLEFVHQNPDLRIGCGDQIMFDYDGKKERINQGWSYTSDLLLNKRPGIVQASTFVHRSVYDKVGLFNKSLRFSMDYEWMVRASRRFQCYHLPAVLTYYHRRHGSITDQGQFNQFVEILKIRRKLGGALFCSVQFILIYYIVTQPLRRIPWLRKAIRQIKTFLGHPPQNPDTQL